MTDYHDLILAVRGKRVVVAGDVMLDRYWVGSADRLSPEAPVPVVDVHEKRAVLGGAANVAANAAALGADVVLVGAIGDDEPGRLLSKLVQEAGITSQLVEAPRPTTVKTRIVAQGQQIARVDEEIRGGLQEHYHRAFEVALIRAIQNAEALVLQDYGKGALSESTVRTVLDIAKWWRVPVIADPKDRDFALYRGATLLKPNAKEFDRAYDEYVHPDRLRKAAAVGDPEVDYPEERSVRALIARAAWGVHGVLVTQGGDGMLLAYKTPSGEAVEFIQSRRVAVADISGAGDTVAAWVGGLVAGKAPVVHAVEIANIAASIQVAKAGTAVVSAEEVLAVLEQEPWQYTERLELNARREA